MDAVFATFEDGITAALGTVAGDDGDEDIRQLFRVGIEDAGHLMRVEGGVQPFIGSGQTIEAFIGGILMKFDLKGEVGLLDFHKVKQLHDLGYETTLRLIDSIRSKVPRTVPLDSVRARREAFKATFPDIRFRNIYVRGATDEQRQYIKREIRDEDEEYFSLDELRQAYFRLLSDNSISEILPTAIYNPFDRSFDLQLDVSLENNVSLMLGGALSTGNISQVYYGFYFNHLGRRSIEVLLDGQLGRTYNNVQLMARLNFFASAIPVSVRILGAYSTIDYYKQDYLFSGSSEPSLNKERESFIKLKTALPFLSQQKAEFGIGVGRITDTYVPGGTLDILNPLYSENDYTLLGGSVFFGQNSLNSPQYATRGRAQYVLAQVFSGTSIYTPADPVLDATFEDVRPTHFEQAGKGFVFATRDVSQLEFFAGIVLIHYHYGVGVKMIFLVAHQF